MLRKTLIISLFFSFIGLKAQLTTSADNRRMAYDREYTLGLSGHGRGYAVNGRYLKFVDGYNKNGLEVEFSKIRHPKEISTPDQFQRSGRGFVFGRVNSFYTLRTGFIREKILFDKTDKGTVSISMIFSGGLSLGLLKPIYVRIADPAIEEIIIERYNPEIHNRSEVIGEASYSTGINETKLKPGIYGKFGFNFDYNLLDEKVTSMEVGLIYDMFFTEVPIFYEQNGGEDINTLGFFQLYIAVNFGYKKN